jgi:hypothetical protein
MFVQVNRRRHRSITKHRVENELQPRIFVIVKNIIYSLFLVRFLKVNFLLLEEYSSSIVSSKSSKCICSMLSWLLGVTTI